MRLKILSFLLLAQSAFAGPPIIWNGNSAKILPSGGLNTDALQIGTLNGVLKSSGGTVSGSATTTDLTEGTNQYFTNTRARGALSATAPLSFDNSLGIFSMPQASGSQNGYLSLGDWTLFNGKQPAGNYITALTGDITATGPGSVTATMAKFVNRVYVDLASGSDVSTGGTPLHPWKTVQYACNNISPTINIPVSILISGGNNDTDVFPITCPPNVELVAPEYGLQLHGVTITGGSTNDGVTVTNIIFLDKFTWVRNDATVINLTFNNVETFAGMDFEQNGTGVGSTFFLAEGGNGVLAGTTNIRAGETIFQSFGEIAGTFNYLDSNAALFLASGGIDLVATLHLNGGMTAEFSGNIADVGYAITGTATGSGTPSIVSDSGSIPPAASITGAYTLSLSSYANHVNTGTLTGVLKSTGANGTIAGSATTTDLPEGTNLYWTQSRFDTAFSGKTTTNLAEGTNLYYTDARVQTVAKNNTSAQMIYVSQDVGNDSTGDGSRLKPYKTIGTGVTAANALAAFYKQVIVWIEPSNTSNGYNENVSLSQQGVNLMCMDSNPNSRICLVNGTLTVNLTGTSGGVNFIAASNEVYVDGLVFANTAQTLTFSGTTYQRLILINSYFQTTGTGNSTAAVSNSGTSGGSLSTVKAYDTVFENNSATAPTVALSNGLFWMLGSIPTVMNDNSAGLSVTHSGGNAIYNQTQLFGEYNLTSNTSQATFNLSTISSGTNPCIVTPSSPSTGYAAMAYFGCTSTNTNSITGSGVVVDFPGNVRTSTSGDIISTVTQTTVPGLPQGEVMIGAGAVTGTNVMLSIKDGHIKIQQTTAPTASPNTAAGTGATCTLSNATDGAGFMNLTFGTTPFTTGPVCTITFNKSYGVAPVCSVWAMNAQAGADQPQHATYVTTSTTQMVLNYGVSQNTQSILTTWGYRCNETQ